MDSDNVLGRIFSAPAEIPGLFTRSQLSCLDPGKCLSGCHFASKLREESIEIECVRMLRESIPLHMNHGER